MGKDTGELWDKCVFEILKEFSFKERKDIYELKRSNKMVEITTWMAPECVRMTENGAGKRQCTALCI